MNAGDTVARAFELARGGSCNNVGGIRRQLKLEGFDQADAHLTSLSLRRQLLGALQLMD